MMTIDDCRRQKAQKGSKVNSRLGVWRGQTIPIERHCEWHKARPAEIISGRESELQQK